MQNNDLVREWLTKTLGQISESTSLTQGPGENYVLTVEKVKCNMLIDAFKETFVPPTDYRYPFLETE